MHSLWLIAFVLTAGLISANASPRDDLASPSQTKRDAAAKLLCASYVPVPRSKWEPFLSQLQAGISTDALEALIKTNGAKAAGSDSGGGGTTASYRLDDDWIVVLFIDDRANKLMEGAKLEPSLASVWAKPSSNFTGRWTTYFVNGRTAYDVDYRDGLYYGDFISYYPEGGKCVVQHYDKSGCNGEDIGYYRSGKVKYRGQYRHNVQVGLWNWYREDGTISSTEKHDP